VPLPGTSLADGFLPNVAASVFAPEPGRYVKVRYFPIYNTGGGTESVTIYIKRSGGTARIVATCSLLTGEWAEVYDGTQEINLSPGDVLNGVSTTAATVSFSIHGEYV